MQMFIDGKIETYKVKLGYFGWSYAAPVVYAKRKLPLVPIYVWKNVWRGNSTASLIAEKQLPEAIKFWFEAAVKEYESYKLKWRDVGVNV